MVGQTSHTIQALLATSKTLYNKPRLCSLRSKCVSIYSEIASSPLQLTLRPSSRFRLVRDPLNVPNFHLMPNQCVPNNMQHLGRASPPPTFLFPFFFFFHAFSVPQLSESTPPLLYPPPPPPFYTPPLLSAPRHPCSPFIRIITDTDIFKHHSHTVKASKSLQLSALSFAHSYLLTALHYNTSLSLEHCSQCFAQEL